MSILTTYYFQLKNLVRSSPSSFSIPLIPKGTGAYAHLLYLLLCLAINLISLMFFPLHIFSMWSSLMYVPTLLSTSLFLIFLLSLGKSCLLFFESIIQGECTKFQLKYIHKYYKTSLFDGQNYSHSSIMIPLSFDSSEHRLLRNIMRLIRQHTGTIHSSYTSCSTIFVPHPHSQYDQSVCNHLVISTTFLQLLIYFCQFLSQSRFHVCTTVLHLVLFNRI